MASPERGRPQLQLELADDLITNGNALSLLDASDDLLSPSVMSKPAWRLDGNARQSRRGLLLSPAGCSSEGSSVATPAPLSDASWPTYAPGPLKVIPIAASYGTAQHAWLRKVARNQHPQKNPDGGVASCSPGMVLSAPLEAIALIVVRPLWPLGAASDACVLAYTDANAAAAGDGQPQLAQRSRCAFDPLTLQAVTMS